MVMVARANDNPTPGPFLKWAGGKTQLLEPILSRLPRRMRTYYEPFIGGGAVFFALAAERRFEAAVIGDANPELVATYRAVRDQPEALIEALHEHQAHATDAEYFYRVRALDPRSLTSIERAARTIFLNRTCFNGLYRMNRKGEFNVPFGKYTNPRVVNPGLIRACSAALANVEILEGDFQGIGQRVRTGDGIYFDPPYVPVSATSSFTSYAQSPFGSAEHARLAELYRECCRRGAVALLSNSDCPATRTLYADLAVETVHATRAINSVATKRGQITEVLVTGLSVRRPLRSEVASQRPVAAVLPLRRRTA